MEIKPKHVLLGLGAAGIAYWYLTRPKPAKAKPPAKLSVADIRVSPEKVAPGETVTVTVRVANEGGPGSGTLVVTADGHEVARTDTGTIRAGGTAMIDLEWTPTKAKSYRVCAEVE